MANYQVQLALESPKINTAIMQAVLELPESSRKIAAHILTAGGKRLRPFLTVLCAKLFGYRSDNIYRLASSMELLHAATLLHDDVLDNAATRRDCQCAHLVYGSTHAVLAGDAMLALGNAIVADFNQPELTTCYSAATMQTAEGEILEMNSLGNPDLAYEQYLAIARGKTACLIANACILGSLIASADSRQLKYCNEFGENLGIAFQIVDDALDFAPGTGKPIGGDLREAKMTPPIMLYRHQLDDLARKNFDHHFTHRSWSEKEYEQLVQAISQFRAQAQAMSEPFLQKALNALGKLPQTEENEILVQMVNHASKRKK